MIPNYCASLSIGYEIDPEKIPTRYRNLIPDEVLLEEDCNPRIGERFPKPERSLNHSAKMAWTFDGEDCCDLLDFLATVAGKVGGLAGLHGDFTGSPGSKIRYFIELSLPGDQDESSSVSVPVLVQHAAKLQGIGGKLRELGFEVGEAMIAAHLSIGCE